jgi:hypothetical protein
MHRFQFDFILLTFLLISSFAFTQAQDKPRDGKILEGEKWLPFSYPKTADFYVSVSGDDNWSGTLAEPNQAKTDGPFLTIGRAQQAVRELKAKIYQPKGTPIEKRWIGTPHPFGSGKDILVYIRGGNYSLSKPLVF